MKLNKFRYSSYLLILIFLSSCFGHRKYVESFFIGKKGIQYFVKPIEYSNLENKSSKLFADFVFQYKDKFRDSDTCNMNFSVFSNTQIPEIQTGQWELDSSKLDLKLFELMYVEKTSKGFISRYHTILPTMFVKQAFLSSGNKIILKTSDGKMYNYYPSKSALKAIKTVNSQVFSLQ